MIVRDSVGGEAREAGIIARLSGSTNHSARTIMPLRGGTGKVIGAVGRLPAITDSWLHALPSNGLSRLHLDLAIHGS